MKILLTGAPGVGKTTVIQRFFQGLRYLEGGFFTQEMREGGKRVGFSLRTLDGEQGVPVLERGLREQELIVIDELGRMELFSRRCEEMVIRIIDQDEQHLLGVIHQGREPFTASIKTRGSVEVIAVSHANHNNLPAQIIRLFSGR